MVFRATKIPEKSVDDQSGKRHTAIGASIRRHRLARKWSLKTLSEGSGIPVSTLSKVENGQMSLSIEKLLSVTNALGIDIMQVVAPAEPATQVRQVTGRRSITRASDALAVETSNSVYRHHAHDVSQRLMSPSVIEVRPGSEPELIRHNGEEFIFVLEGRVEAFTEFYSPVTLEVGDSIYIDSSMGHNLRALDGTIARVLNVSSSTTGLAGGKE